MKNLNLKLTKITPNTKNKKNNFYLGAWCLADMTSSKFDDFMIHEYHWNDRKKLNKDYNSLNKFLFSNFEIISKYMGEITGAPKDSRYWKINLGMWAGHIIQILFDRWENIRTLPQFEFHLSNKSINISLLRSNTVRDFFKDLRTDQWNEDVYRLILKAQNRKINYEELIISNSVTTFQKKSSLGLKNSYSFFRLKLIKYLTKFSHQLQQPKYFIVGSYLDHLDEIKLKLLLKQIPLIYNAFIFHPKIDYKSLINKNNKYRPLKPINLKFDKMSPWENQNKDFLIWFKDVLPNFIPYNYSLNFNQFLIDMKALPFPKQPKVIFTSNLYNSFDYFNLYTSNKVYSGSKYIIGQHGGTFRSAKLNYSEYIQKNISDYYLTWGKDNQDDELFRAKIVSVGNFKTSSQKLFKKKVRINRILLLTVDLPRYSLVVSSVPISSQFLFYYDDLKKFYKKLLDLDLSHKIVVRNKDRKYAWDISKKLLHQFPNINFDKIENYYNSIKLSSLVISTTNGATFLETMSMNIPTIFFWDSKYWELRSSSVKDYEELIKVGIFHTNPCSAAEFIHKINSDIEDWWYSEKVQAAREKFCKKYSKKEINISNKIMRIITKKFD